MPWDFRKRNSTNGVNPAGTLRCLEFYTVVCQWGGILTLVFFRLYPSCEWEDKLIRKLIGDGKIAARLEGAADRRSVTDVECPICFLNYSEVNVTSCCQANICTECFLQVKPQKGGKTGSCPFCNTARMQVSVAKPEPKMLPVESPLPATPERPNKNPAEEAPDLIPGTATDASSIGSGGFGSTLEQHVKSRPGLVTEDSVRSLALTPEERKQLETQVRAQHFHPLTMRLQQEEAERRLRNELEYYTSSSTTTGTPSRSQRYVTEEQQIAMAIEASLRDAS